MSFERGVHTLLLLTAVASARALAAPSGDPARDRDAILAMAGEFEVTFQFVETVPLRSGYRATKPYRATALERVQVLEDSGRRVVLQHLLLAQSGEVIKHWRQVWEYEDPLVYEFAGRSTWRPRRLAPDQVKKTWTQSVFGVDDAPRYEGVGRWRHEANVSSWESDTTWRPLPRREYTRRDDYDVLVGRNRHTVTPSGWVHEQDNLKLALRGGEEPALTREAGVNTYRRVEGVDLAAAEAYWRHTESFWRDVRRAWDELLDGRKTVRLAARVDGRTLGEHLFAVASSERAGRYDSAEGGARIGDILGRFVQ